MRRLPMLPVLAAALVACLALVPTTVSAQDPAPKPTPEKPAKPDQPPKPARPAPDRPAPDSPEQSRGARLIERFDANQDGKLAMSELPEAVAERMAGADSDGDGFITLAEIDAMPRPERRGRGAGGEGGAGEAGGRGRGRGEGDGADPRRRMAMGDPAAMILRMDKDGDGQLTKDELPARMAERLMAADLDENGVLTLVELTKAAEKQREERAKGMLQRMDQNEDGKLMLTEIPERMRPRMEALDTDKNGELTLKELMAAPTDRAGPGRAGPGRRGGGDAEPTPAGGDAARNPAQVMSRLDRNGDGKLSGDEIPSWMQRRMETLDKNGDGELTVEELGGGEKQPAPKPKKEGVDL